MGQATPSYKAMISTDWNECLAPCGPFDCIRFSHPELADRLGGIFRQYTGNQISLGEAAGQIESLLPEGISIEQMDAYLDAEFRTYTGVPDLIQWCRSHAVLFMINTTGMIGYFQRAFAKGLLPPVPVLSAHPSIRYPKTESDPLHTLALFETRDKGRHTAAVAKRLGIRVDRIIVMGDSGGDGPHFEWGAQAAATLVGSMTKASLDDYCRKKRIGIHHRFGVTYAPGERPDRIREMTHNFMNLTTAMADILKA